MKINKTSVSGWFFAVLTLLWLLLIFGFSSDDNTISFRRTTIIGWNLLDIFEPGQHPENPLRDDTKTEKADAADDTPKAAVPDTGGTAKTNAPGDASVPVSAIPKEIPRPVPVKGLFGHSTGLYTADLRKTAHFLLYTILSLLLFATFRTLFCCSTLRACCTDLAIGAVCAFFDELHQYFVPGRGAVFSDIRLDISGVMAGIYLISIAALLHKAVRKPKKSMNNDDKS